MVNECPKLEAPDNKYITVVVRPNDYDINKAHNIADAVSRIMGVTVVVSNDPATVGTYEIRIIKGRSTRNYRLAGYAFSSCGYAEIYSEAPQVCDRSMMFTACHELGHLLGFNYHTNNPCDVMSEYVPSEWCYKSWEPQLFPQ